ncbi:MAG: TasA family protein [Syntrophomonas sp.]
MKNITQAKQKFNRRIGMIVVTIVLSLGLIGSAVAMYSDTITATHNINTGGVDVKFVNGSSKTMSLETCTLLIGETANRQFSLVNTGKVPMNFKDDSATLISQGAVNIVIHWPQGANATLDPEAQMNVTVDISPGIAAVPGGSYPFTVKIKATPWNGYTQQWDLDDLELQGTVTIPVPVEVKAEGSGG